MVTADLPYNRALHGDDYRVLDPYVARLREFERRMQGLHYRKDHQHREWEYANVLKQLDDLGFSAFPDKTRILDTGFGINYFSPYLRTLGYDITVEDSEAYGPVTDVLRSHCFHLGITIPLVTSPIEDLHDVLTSEFDVTMCISVIEHLPTLAFARGLQELWRVTKPGGYLFITSDYFKDEAHALQSPSIGIQHNRFYPHTAEAMINDAIIVEWAGGVDLTYHEPGMVNGHSFVNFVLRKPMA